MDLENENLDLLNSLQECQDDVQLNQDKSPTAIKKGSKTDLINEIFDLCKRANIACEHSEGQLKRMNKKKLLELLALYCERVVEAKVLEKCNIKEKMDNMNDKQKTKLMNIGILRMAHDSLCYAAENATARFTPYTIEGMTRQMKEHKEMSDQIDQCLAEIAEEYDVLTYIESPASRLMLIWMTAGVSNLRKKQICHKKNVNVSKRVQFKPIESTPPNRHELNRGTPTRQISNAQQNITPSPRRI
jgi:hypothetical protein